jgi:hypothetical protein
MQAQRGGGGHADTRSGTGHRVRLTRTAQSTHRQAGIPALPGSRAAYLLVLYQTIHAVTARRDVEPSWTVSGEALFPVHLPQRQDTLPAASMRVKVWASSPEPARRLPEASRHVEPHGEPEDAEMVSQRSITLLPPGRARGRPRPVHTPGSRWRLRCGPKLSHLQL